MGSDAPRWIILLSAWSNIFAGITLIISFSVYFLALQLNHCDPRSPEPCATAANHGIVFNGRDQGHGYYMVAKWMMFSEGFLWWFGGALLCYRNICNANAGGAVSQCLISTGGFFFTCSAFGSPANIISLRYLIPITYFPDGDGTGTMGSSGTTWVSFSDACPFYGITTFMIATVMGMYSVRGLPKNRIVSPFYGVLSFFIGAWVIGVITLFVPMLAGGETKWEDLNPAPCIAEVPPYDPALRCMLDMPSFAWYQLKIFSIIGALFLLAGGVIFGIMDNFLCLPAKDNKLLATDGLAA